MAVPAFKFHRLLLAAEPVPFAELEAAEADFPCEEVVNEAFGKIS